MARFHQGKYTPINPDKYMGDPTKIIYRSSWERKCMKKFDTALWIVKWSSEETIIPYISPLDNRPHRYFVDFMIVVQTGQDQYQVSLVEVKPFKETMKPESKGKSKKRFLTEIMTYSVNQAKWDAAKAFCSKKGWQFVVMTEKDIYPGGK